MRRGSTKLRGSGPCRLCCGPAAPATNCFPVSRNGLCFTSWPARPTRTGPRLPSGPGAHRTLLPANLASHSAAPAEAGLSADLVVLGPPIPRPVLALSYRASRRNPLLVSHGSELGAAFEVALLGSEQQPPHDETTATWPFRRSWPAFGTWPTVNFLWNGFRPLRY